MSAAQNSATVRGRPFVKDDPRRNAGGRPKAVRELLERARQSVPAAFDLAESLLADVDADARVRLDAAKFLASYGLGAPPKTVAADDDDGDSTATKLTPDTALRVLMAAPSDDDAEH